MKAYFTFTETSLRRRPSLFPGTRSPSATLGLPFPTPSTEHAPRASVPAHHRHAPTSRRSPSSPESEPPTHSPGQHPVSYTHLRAHETRHDLVCRLLLEK